MSSTPMKISSPVAIETKTIHELDYLGYIRDGNTSNPQKCLGLEQILKQVYGENVIFNSTNDMTYRANVNLAAYDTHAQNRVKSAIAQGEIEDYDLEYVLMDLASKSVIPEGQYVINVSW